MINTLKSTFRDDHAVIDLNSDVSEDVALALEAAFEKLFSYYQYERVVLRVNSPGGLLSALRHILESVEDWRKKGHKIETEVTFCAASAAGILLSFGEVGTRTAHRHSNVLYHHSRIGSNASVITASGANYLASLLKSTDHGLVKRLVNHIAASFGDGQAFSAQGEMRCKLLVSHGVTIAKNLELESDSIALRWLKPTANMYREMEKKGSLEVYRRHLAKRMDADSSMDLREAYALCLIDRVVGVPELCMLPQTAPDHHMVDPIDMPVRQSRKSSDTCQPILLFGVSY